MKANSTVITETNSTLFGNATIIIAIISVFMTIASVYDKRKVIVIAMHVVSIAISLIFYLINRFTSVGKSRIKLLLTMYLCYGYYLFYTIVTSVVFSEDSIGVYFIVTMIVGQIMIFDDPRRVFAVTSGFSVLFILTSYFHKDFMIATNDMINCFSFLVLGLVLNINLVTTKLQGIEDRRQILIQRDTDLLTGLPNRTKLYEVISGSYGKYGEETISGFMMIDIDLFKQYNDTFGHQKGDECLMVLGKLFGDFAEENNLMIFRYGGEEFLVATFNHNDVEMGVLAEKLLDLVRGLDIKCYYSPHRKLTISLGYISSEYCRCSGYEREISMADKALYAAKNKGRNCAVNYLDCADFNIEQVNLF